MKNNHKKNKTVRPETVSHQNESKIPLFVDLDGTLTPSDLLYESLLSLLRKNILYLFLLPLWLMKGRAFLKHEIARRCDLDVSLIPCHEEFSAFLKKEQQKGREIILATASDRMLAEKIAGHFPFFSSVIASDGSKNCSGSIKLERIKEKAKGRAFDYAGNHAVDLAIWKDARKALMVGSSPSLKAKLKGMASSPHFFDTAPFRLLTLIKAMRIHQWSKNFLLFVPLILAHRIHHSDLFIRALSGWLAFGLVASAVYLINDLFDLETDRKSSKKKHRPFASGQMSLLSGMMVVPFLLIAAFLIAINLPQPFIGVIAIYFGLTFLYSLKLKQIAILDVIVLAFLYTVRIIAGGLLVEVPLSFWLLALSVFLFFSLALAKRYAELKRSEEDGILKVDRRGYTANDMEILSQFGSMSGLISVLVLALYIHSEEVVSLYSNQTAIWIFCPILLYWISRIWLLTRRGELNEDPVVFVLFDKISYLLFAIGGVALWLAI